MKTMNEYLEVLNHKGFTEWIKQKIDKSLGSFGAVTEKNKDSIFDMILYRHKFASLEEAIFSSISADILTHNEKMRLMLAIPLMEICLDLDDVIKNDESQIKIDAMLSDLGIQKEEV